MFCKECGKDMLEVKIPRGFDADTGKPKFDLHNICSSAGCEHSGHVWKDLPEHKIDSVKTLLKWFSGPPDKRCVVCGSDGYFPDY
jgi:hypothetical protein